MTNPLIIDKPELQSPQQKYFFSTLTFIFWIVWFYLWLPILSLIAWLLGIDFFYENMIILGGVEGLMSVIGWYSLVIALSALTLVAWSAYNIFRFRNKNRRQSIKLVSKQDMATYFNIDEQSVDVCTNERRIVIENDLEGKIVSINGAPQ